MLAVHIEDTRLVDGVWVTHTSHILARIPRAPQPHYPINHDEYGQTRKIEVPEDIIDNMEDVENRPRLGFYWPARTGSAGQAPAERGGPRQQSRGLAEWTE
jgi:hypothetical protein